jgi:hypothetical protein
LRNIIWSLGSEVLIPNFLASISWSPTSSTICQYLSSVPAGQTLSLPLVCSCHYLWCFFPFNSFLLTPSLKTYWFFNGLAQDLAYWWRVSAIVFNYHFLFFCEVCNSHTDWNILFASYFTCVFLGTLQFTLYHLSESQIPMTDFLTAF